jgi:hypothetical protein
MPKRCEGDHLERAPAEEHISELPKNMLTSILARLETLEVAVSQPPSPGQGYDAHR